MTAARLAGLVLLAVLLTATRADGATPPLVNLVRGTTYELRDAGPRATIAVPVTLAPGLRARDLRVTVVSVALGAREDRGLVRAFRGSLVAGSRVRGPRLELAVDTAAASASGTYNVILAVRQVRGGRRSQRLTLEVVHPPAAVRAPAPVVVERRGSFLGLGGRTSIRPLRLAETSRKTRLSDVAVEQADGPVGGAVTTGEVVFNTVTDLPPGGRARVVPELEGDFPLGTSTGTLVVDAPQLADPVSVAYEIRFKRSLLWLVLAILAGIVLGSAVRVWLRDAILRNEARQQAYAVLEAIGAARDRRADAGFRETVDAVAAELTGVLEGKPDAPAIKSAAEKARTELAASVEELDRRLADGEIRFDALAAVLRSPWRVPAKLLEPLAAQQEALAAVRAALDTSNATAAEARLAAADAELAAAVRERAEPWASGVRAFTAAVDELELPAAVAAEVEIARKEIAADLERAGLNAPQVDPARVMAGVHDAEGHLRRLLAETLGQISFTVVAVAGVLEDGGAASSADLRELRRTERALGTALRDAVTGERDWDALVDRAREVTAALRAPVLRGLTGDARKQVEATLAGGLYVEAARTAVAARPKGNVVLGQARQAASEEAFGPTLVARRDDVVAPAPVPARGARRAGAGFDLRLARSRTAAVLVEVTLLRDVIVGAVLMAIGFALFQGTFVGSVDQLVAAFLWGFAGDVTAQGVIDLARAGGAPPATVTQ